MSLATSLLPVTPRKKRSAFDFDSDLSLRVAAIKVEGTPELPGNTPDVHDVPDFGWDDTPQSQDYSARTPSPARTPSKAPAKPKETVDTPKRQLKLTKRSPEVDVQEASRPTQQESKIYHATEAGYIDLQPPVPLRFVYPKLPSKKDSNTQILKYRRTLNGLMDFHFSAMERNADQDPRQERVHLQKRSRTDLVVLEQSIEHETTSPASEAPIIDTAVPRRSRIATKANIVLNTARFSRILPFDAISRLMEKPNRCVASLVNQRSERCSFPIELTGNAKNKLLDRLAELEDPSSLIKTQSYLEEVVDALTCKRYHQKIATEQLERLLDWHMGRRSRSPHNKHDFKSTDLDSLECWLQAWTTLPKGSSQPLPKVVKVEVSASTTTAINASQTNVSFSAEQFLRATKPVSSLAKESQIEKASANITGVNRPKADNLSARSKDTVEAGQTGPASKIAKILDVIITELEIDNSEDEKQSDISNGTFPVHSREAAQEHGVAQIFVDEGQTSEKMNTMTTVTAETHEVVSATESKEKHAPESLENDLRILRSQPISKFDPTQFGENAQFHFEGMTQLVETLTKTSPRQNIQRLSKPQTNLQQDLHWFYDKLDCSVEGYISTMLTKQLMPRKFQEGLIYMYWITGSFGFVNIGVTSRKSTAKRLGEWRKKCGHIIEEHKQDGKSTVLRLPNVYRIEALVHAELREARLKEKRCRGCGGGHDEWFAVSPEEGRKVIQKWSAFMMTEPYDRYGRLKESIDKDTIATLCKPIGNTFNAGTPLAVSKPRIALKSSPGLETGRGTLRSGGRFRQGSTD